MLYGNLAPICKANMTDHCQLLIVGAGAFGTSTAYHYAQVHSDPSSTVVIDRAAYPPQHAAATDISKIFRADYHERFYMDLAYEALEQWKTSPELKKHFHQVGRVALGSKGSDLHSRVRDNFRARGRDPTKDVALGELRDVFGGIYAQTDLSAIDRADWNPEAGLCDAGAAAAELMQAAVDRGVKYETGDVARLMPGASGVRGVQLSDGRTFTADKVLLCAGAWTSSLMGPVEDHLQMDDESRFEHQAVAAGYSIAHYALGEQDVVDLKAMPVSVYGHTGDVQPFPHGNLLKVTNYRSVTNTIVTGSGHRTTVPPDRDQKIVPDRLKAENRGIIRHKLFPQFTSRPGVYWRLCWDAMTPSQDHVITKHPDPRLENLYVAVGGSFHSCKFLPNIGKYIVKVLTGVSNGPEHDRHWAWKQPGQTVCKVHAGVYPTRELRDVEDEHGALPVPVASRTDQ